jgi:hypothetical protein
MSGRRYADDEDGFMYKFGMKYEDRVWIIRYGSQQIRSGDRGHELAADLPTWRKSIVELEMSSGGNYGYASISSRARSSRYHAEYE